MSNFPLCSFCGKSKDEVKGIIVGPYVYICDECVVLCTEILECEQHIKPVSTIPPIEAFNELWGTDI